MKNLSEPGAVPDLKHKLDNPSRGRAYRGPAPRVETLGGNVRTSNPAGEEVERSKYETPKR
jgi:hypothetical protein